VAVEVKLPRLGQGMEAGTIVRWLKSEGDAVAKGEPLYELDTDKVTQEVEAEAGGVLLTILVPEGEVGVGTTIAVIGAEGEEIAVSPPAGAGPPEAVTEAKAEEEIPALERPAPAPSRDGGRVKASPLARRMARERGIDLTTLQGTGPDGRIVAEDVETAALPAREVPPTAPAEVEVIRLSSLRKTVARRLAEAWEAPVFQLTVTADASELVATRERMVALLREGDTKPTVNDLLTRLVARALMRHRAVNAHFVGDEIRRYATANVGIAVATPNGLIVPVIREAERKSVQEIAAERADLVGRARHVRRRAVRRRAQPAAGGDPRGRLDRGQAPRRRRRPPRRSCDDDDAHVRPSRDRRVGRRRVPRHGQGPRRVPGARPLARRCGFPAGADGLLPMSISALAPILVVEVQP
jgi:pyruvate dehydrogenase E2 component (dihydrolipoamide acetyltransferase)